MTLMKTKLRQIIRSKRGMAYVDMVVLILVSVMAIVLALNVFTFFTVRNDMDLIASKTAEVAALNGTTNLNTKRKLEDGSSVPSIQETFASLCAAEGYGTQAFGSGGLDLMSVKLDAPDGTYGSDGAVQLGSRIHVTIHYETNFRGLGLLSEAIRMPVTVETETLSRVYHK